MRAAHLIIGIATLVAMPLCEATEPCSRFMPEYHSGVDRVIDAAVGKPARLAITTLPSFTPESGVRLVGGDVYFVKFEKMFWAESQKGGGRMDFSAPRIATSVHVAPLSADLANAIERLFGRSIAAAKPTNITGIDGTAYRFVVSGAGCGQAWSPSKGSRDYGLVELGALLEKHAQLLSASERRNSESAIARAIRGLDGG